MSIAEVLARLAQGERLSSAKREYRRRRVTSAQTAVAEDLNQPIDFKAEEEYEDGKELIE